MARLIWMVLMAALVAALLYGASWVAAYAKVADLLGSPPPEMGTQKTTFLWHGVPQLRGHPRGWRFAYGPTHIPGAPSVTIYIGLAGKVLLTEPGDLESRVKLLHP
jgi:hypothetical protein